MQLKLTKRGRRNIFIGIVAYLLFLLVTLPATIMTNHLLPSFVSEKNLSLQSVDGTVWQGEAAGVRFGSQLFNQLEWDLSAWSLLLGEASVDVNMSNDESYLSGQLAMGFGGTIGIDDFEFKSPAAIVVPELTKLVMPFGFDVSGKMRGSIQEAEIKQGEVLRIKGRLVWESAVVVTPQHMELGTFVMTCEPNNNGTHFTIKDTNNSPLQMNLKIQFEGNGNYQISGWLKARDRNNQVLTSNLGFIARADSEGKHNIKLKSKIPGWKEP